MNPFASVIGKEEIEKGEYSNFKGISIVFSDKNRCNLTTNSLPESTYATMAFVGTYKNIDTHFQHLIKWISDNHYEVTGDGLVLIITDKAYSDFEYEYISEIQIPVKKFLKTS
jgi:effector-binding domain-containing protein